MNLIFFQQAKRKNLVIPVIKLDSNILSTNVDKMYSLYQRVTESFYLGKLMFLALRKYTLINSSYLNKYYLTEWTRNTLEKLVFKYSISFDWNLNPQSKRSTNQRKIISLAVR
jgi:hypothetical protein